MIWARLKLVWLIFKSLIKHKKVTEDTEKEAQTWELVATLDVLWAAIPLGILTALEAFYFEDIAHVTPSKVFELIKLGALAIDLIGVSFFFYFEVAGLNKVFNKCYKHNHHETAAINQGADEKSPLIISSERDIAPSDANV
jgi:heme/copper-type cytochrome/quinol oxidase subunit 2